MHSADALRYVFKLCFAGGLSHTHINTHLQSFINPNLCMNRGVSYVLIPFFYAITWNTASRTEVLSSTTFITALITLLFNFLNLF